MAEDEAAKNHKVGSPELSRGILARSNVIDVMKGHRVRDCP